jgi:hypothetical protein
MKLKLMLKQLFCKHDVMPFDNDKTCMHCAKDMRVKKGRKKNEKKNLGHTG